LSDELNCGVNDIVSVELSVCDTQPSCLGGGNNEFIFSGRLDNLASSYCALRALIDSCKLSSDLSSEHAIRMIALFDNEEVIIFHSLLISRGWSFMSILHACHNNGNDLTSLFKYAFLNSYV
jgi:hypothetical protein